MLLNFFLSKNSDWFGKILGNSPIFEVIKLAVDEVLQAL